MTRLQPTVQRGPTLVDHIVIPDLVAPGNGVISLLASPTCTLVMNSPKTQVKSTAYETLGVTATFSSNYFQLSGTSMATPVVSGAAALLLQKNPALTPGVKARLMKTARKILPAYMSGTDLLQNVTYMAQADVFGAGYLDVFAALQSNDLVTLSRHFTERGLGSVHAQSCDGSRFLDYWGRLYHLGRFGSLGNERVQRFTEREADHMG